jgi:hypothetical protein
MLLYSSIVTTCHRQIWQARVERVAPCLHFGLLPHQNRLYSRTIMHLLQALLEIIRLDKLHQPIDRELPIAVPSPKSQQTVQPMT